MRALTLGFVVLAIGCGSEPNSILVTIASLPANTDHLTVTATLAGKPAMSMSITNPKDQFGVKLDPNAAGHLVLNIAANDTDECTRGAAAPEFDLPLSYTSLPVTLSTQNPRKCGTLPACDPSTVCSINKTATANLEGFWSFSSKDIWGVGHMGTIVHYDGVSWTPYDFGLTPPSGDFYGVWGSAPDDIWAVGSFGLIWHYNGMRWSGVMSPTTRDLYAVYGASKNEVFAVGLSPTPGTTQGAFLQYNGSWASITTAGTDTFNGVWADNSSGSRFVYACGNNGLLVRYDASVTPAWAPIISNTTVNLRGIWGTRSSQTGKIDSTVFAVGGGGTIIRIRYGVDSGWSPLPGNTINQTLYGLRGDDVDTKSIFAFGQNGTVARAVAPYDTFVGQSSSAGANIYGGAFGGKTMFWLGGAGGYQGFVDINP